MRSISRIADVSINTVAKLLAQARGACAIHHFNSVVGMKSNRVQCDEFWSFCYAKQKNVATAKAAPYGAGGVWTWTALDRDTKFIISYFVGGRDAECANFFMDDLRFWIDGRMQLTTDGHGVYLDAVAGAFGANIDYAMLVSSTASRRRAPAPRSATARPSALARRRCRSQATRTPSMSLRRM